MIRTKKETFEKLPTGKIINYIGGFGDGIWTLAKLSNEELLVVAGCNCCSNCTDDVGDIFKVNSWDYETYELASLETQKLFEVI